MSLVRGGPHNIAVLSPSEWNERRLKLHSRETATAASPAVSRVRKCRRTLRQLWTRHWKIGAVAFTYWLVWIGFSLYVISRQ